MGDFGYLMLGVAIGAGALYGYHCYVRPLPSPGGCGCGGHDDEGSDDPAAAISEAPEGDADAAELEALLQGVGEVE